MVLPLAIATLSVLPLGAIGAPGPLVARAPLAVDVRSGQVRSAGADTAWIVGLPNHSTKAAASTDGATISLSRSARSTTISVRGATDRVARRTRTIKGLWRFPVPVADEPAQPVSADGSKILLARADADGEFAVMAADLRSMPEFVSLGSQYTFDAASPSGDLLYLTEHRNGAEYAVRAYKMVTRELVSEPVVVKGERSGVMTGSPMARATSPDGEWVYTLYERQGAAPFIHALNTEGMFSLCIDLPPHGDVAGANTAWALGAAGSSVVAANTALGQLWRAPGTDLSAKPRSVAIPVTSGRPVLSAPALFEHSVILGTQAGLWAVEVGSLTLTELAKGVAVERILIGSDGVTAFVVGERRAGTIAVDLTTGARLTNSTAAARLGRTVLYG